jgi:hypothetical protein
MFNRIPLILIFTLVAANVFSQRVVDVDKLEGSALSFLKSVGGEPISNTKFVRLVDGSPYFTDEWIKGSVFIDESEYRNIHLRLNILETSLEFQDSKGEVMVCTQPVKRVVLKDSAHAASYSFVHSRFLPSSSEFRNTWLLELVSGNASLYRVFKKQINEVRPYGSATTEQHILTSYAYFLLQNNTFTRIKKTADIVDLLGNKKAELLNFIKTNNLSNKEEGDMIKLIAYYNSL